MKALFKLCLLLLAMVCILPTIWAKPVVVDLRTKPVNTPFYSSHNYTKAYKAGKYVFSERIRCFPIIY